jgi:VWFA-related protein
MSLQKYSVLLLALPLWAQAPQAPQPPLILRSTTRLVQLNVIVQDKKGNPVTDLKKEDFEIKDAGKVQTVSLFSMESNAPLPTAAEPLPPNVFTNKLERRAGTPSSVSVILLDWLNTKFADRAYAQAQVVKFLQQQIKPEDHIGLYTLSRGLRVLHDYTSDSTELLARLNSSDGKSLPDLSRAESRSAGDAMLLDTWLRGGGASRAEADFYTINRVNGTLKAIEFIANHLSAVPGRKNLIWVSGGFPLEIGFDSPAAMRDPAREQRTFSDEIDRAVRAVNNANLAIYPVDARGLMTSPQFSAERRGNANRRPPRIPPPAPGSKNQDTMRELASRTGGRAYINTNDLNKAIRDAIQDTRVTYTLGFYPSGEKFDGKFHELKVKVERPGANIRYRKGYFDFAEQPQDEKTRKTELRDAVWSPMEASALGLVVQVQPDASKPTSLNVFVKIDPHGISLQQQGGRWDGRLDLLFVQKDDRGGQFNGTSDTMELQLLQANYEKVSTEGLIYKKTIEMAPQANQLRVVVRDAASGTVGTVTIPFREIKK